MLAAKTVRSWYRVHKWTSLICTVFLLILCVTGLPLVFRDEIHDWQGFEKQAREMPADTPLANLDRVVRAAQSLHPGQTPEILTWDDDRDNVIEVQLGDYEQEKWKHLHLVSVDARTAEVMEEFKPHTDFITKFMGFMTSVHEDLYLEEPGRLFLGLMGLLFVVSLVSGAVVYGPFMRKLNFGVLRVKRTPRIKWLDRHNLLGIVVLMWALVVGLTGMINTIGDLFIKLWEVKTLSAMMRPYRNKPPLQKVVEVERVFETARRTVPDMTPYYISFPGGPYTTTRHFDVLLKGRTPFTSKLVKPVLIDAETGDLTTTKDLPWHLKAILLSQPLHFGDYGGLPLKIIWALFDVAAIVVLFSGLYLWMARRKTLLEENLDELVAFESTPGPNLAKGSG